MHTASIRLHRRNAVLDLRRRCASALLALDADNRRDHERLHSAVSAFGGFRLDRLTMDQLDLVEPHLLGIRKVLTRNEVTCAADYAHMDSRDRASARLYIRALVRVVTDGEFVE